MVGHLKSFTDFFWYYLQPVLLKMHYYACAFKKEKRRTSLVAQWLRIHLPMQGTHVRALVLKDPTCCGATKPVCHNY